MMSVGMLVRRQLLHGGPAVRFASVTLMAAAVVWGFVECHYTVRVLDEANVVRDEALPVARRLEQLAGDDPNRFQQTVLSFDGIFADDMPTVAPQNVLWSRHQHVFAGLTSQENKERYYRYLYYSGVDERGLERLLKKDFVSQIALFGWGRHSDRLSSESKPLTFGEIAVEARNYGRFIETFSSAAAGDPLISYVVADSEYPPNLNKLELWYQLYEPETIGKYTLYKARLK